MDASLDDLIDLAVGSVLSISLLEQMISCGYLSAGLPRRGPALEGRSCPGIAPAEFQWI